MNKVTPAIVVKSKFILPGANRSNFKNYISYIDRKNSHYKENEFENYQDYMSNEEKSTGLFTNESDSLDKNEKIRIKELFKKAHEKNSILWQDVISFDNQWLKENGLLKDNFLDEKKLKQATRNAVNEMWKREGLNETIAWTAAIHYNTDNIHVHVASVQTRNFRIRGKRKQKSIEAVKSKVINTLLDRSKENEYLNDFIRNKVVHAKRNDDLTSIKNNLFNRDLVKQFKKVHSMLPADKRLWQYGMNGIKEARPEIDKLTTMYIDKHFKNEFKEFKTLLEKEVQVFKQTYGDTARAEKYRETKTKDLYKRMGNTILKELKRYDTDKYKKDKNKKLQNFQLNRSINTFMYVINREMRDNLQQLKNQRAYEEFEREREWANNHER